MQVQQKLREITGLWWYEEVPVASEIGPSWEVSRRNGTLDVPFPGEFHA
jgi:hypothetical protein